jgi:hypothetical protein
MSQNKVFVVSYVTSDQDNDASVTNKFFADEKSAKKYFAECCKDAYADCKSYGGSEDDAYTSYKKGCVEAYIGCNSECVWKHDYVKVEEAVCNGSSDQK